METDKETPGEDMPEGLSIDARRIPNPVLKRLIEEVKVERQNNVNAYNRCHNRHNRGR